MTLLLVIGMTPVFAVSVGTGVGIDIETEDFAPAVYFDSDERLVLDDNTPTGRNAPGTDLAGDRVNNYAFEGEKVTWSVLVHDRNGIETLMGNPSVTVGPTQGTGNDEEALCDVGAQLADGDALTEFNVRDGPDALVFDADTMRVYDCTLTVESPDSMDGEFWITAEATDSSGLSGAANENEFWWFNPVIALDINGALDFGTVRPGATSYSTTLTVGNDASPGSGVLLDMFISGSDFTDPASSGAKCPTTNELNLNGPDGFVGTADDAFRYLATNGAHSSALSNGAADAQGYSPIPNGARITEADQVMTGDDYLASAIDLASGNVLAPGAELSVTLRLALPNPCNGDFTDGSIWFWAEAV